mgnify:CR=1 FL=1
MSKFATNLDLVILSGYQVKVGCTRLTVMSLVQATETT